MTRTNDTSIPLAAQQLAQKADWRWDEGKRDEARALFQQAVEIAPTYTYARANLAALLLEDDAWEEAYPHLEHLANVDEITEPTLLNAYGLLLLEEHRDDEAEEIFRHIIALHPSFDLAYANLAVIFADRGETQSAIDALTLFLEHTQDDEETERAEAMLEELQRHARPPSTGSRRSRRARSRRR